MFWALALLSLSLAAAPAVTKPVATKGKATPAKAAAKAPAKIPTKTPPKVTAKAPVARVPTKAATPYRAPAATTATRGRVQPQYARYANNRRPVATGRAAVARQQRPVYHPVPMVPTPERTKEIQSALVQKGYLTGEPSGTWDADSVNAMKRFQKEQNLEADGKFSSLSLIALGLGPKRTLTASSVNPPAAVPTPSTTNPVPPKP